MSHRKEHQWEWLPELGNNWEWCSLCQRGRYIGTKDLYPYIIAVAMAAKQECKMENA